jgi:arsenate reductase
MLTDRDYVLIVCDGNHARSQMAEGLLRQMGRGRFHVASAGAHPRDAVHPMAVQVMAEVGIDIRSGYPKPVHIFRHDPVKVAICVCDAASQACATFPSSVEREHWSLVDPAQGGTPEDQLAAFRTVRDDLRARLEAWLARQEIAASTERT